MAANYSLASAVSAAVARISCSARNDKIDVDLALTFASSFFLFCAQLLQAEKRRPMEL